MFEKIKRIIFGSPSLVDQLTHLCKNIDELNPILIYSWSSSELTQQVYELNYFLIDIHQRGKDYTTNVWLLPTPLENKPYTSMPDTTNYTRLIKSNEIISDDPSIEIFKTILANL